MIISIHPDRLGKQSYSEKWALFLQQKGVKANYVNLYKNDSLEQLRNSDGLMWRWNLEFPDRILAPTILDVIEHEIRIPVYPDYKMRYAWDDKIKQSYIFKTKGIKTPKTWIFWNEDDAMRWINSADFPLIFKFASGASSRNVYLIENKSEAILIIKNMFSSGIFTSQNLIEFMTKNVIKKFYYNFKNLAIDLRNIMFDHKKYISQIKNNLLQKHYVYFQEYISGNDFDTRVTIIGNRAFAFRRFNKSNDFRASGSGKIDYNIDEVNIAFILTAFEISKKLGCSCIAYDFLLKKNTPVILEMCWTFNDEAVYKCPGHWNSDIKWIEGNMWPEEAQVEDFLQRINQSTSQT